MPFVFSSLYPKVAPSLQATVASKLTASSSIASPVFTMPIITQQALAALAKRNFTFLSDIPDNDDKLDADAKEHACTVGLAHYFSIYDSKVLHSGSCRFVGTRNGKTSTIIHSLINHVPKNRDIDEAKMIGINSDRINNNTLAMTDDMDIFHRCFVSMLTADDLAAVKFLHSDLIFPDSIEKPDSVDTNSFTDLGFPGANGGTMPKIVLVPALCAIPLGYYAPSAQDLSQELPPPPAGKKYWPPMVMWFKAVHYLFSKNDGKPLTIPSADGNLLVKGESIDSQLVLEMETDYSSFCLKNTISVNLQDLPEDNPLYHEIIGDVLAQYDKMLSFWWEMADLTPEERNFLGPASPPPAALPAASSPTDQASAIAAALRESKLSEKERSEKKGVQLALTKYSILLGRGTNDDGSAPVLATIRPEFRTILAEPSKLERARVLAQCLQQFIDCNNITLYNY